MAWGWNVLFALTSMTALASAARGELELESVDATKGSWLKNWAENASGESGVAILAGDAEESQVIQTLKKWNAAYLGSAENLMVLDARDVSDTPQLAVKQRVARWLRERQVGGEIPWSVVVVRNAQRMDRFDLNEVLLRFWKQTICVDPHEGLSVKCSNLLIVLDTDFGKEKTRELRLNQKNFDQSYIRRTIEADIHRDIRMWACRSRKYKGIERMCQHLHQLVFPIVGPEPSDKVAELIEYHNERRKQAQQTKATPDSGAIKCDNQIDVDFFDRSGFVGQEHIVGQVKKALNSVRVGMKTNKAPLVFLFAGPAGLGKTMLAHLVAQAYNCGQDASALHREYKFMQIDMVNYQDERAVDGFVDPSPGLQGSGLMSEVFTKETRAVILLDEIEKSHPSLLRRMLLPMLDSHGHVQVKKTGQRISTSDAIFILTTNCFGEEVQKFWQSRMQSSESESSGAVSAEEYDILAKQFAGIMRNSSLTCQDAFQAGTNPFASEPLWRRLLAGHYLANPHGLFLFLPPTMDHVDKLVEETLERYSERLERYQLYYAPKVLRWLQKSVRAVFKDGHHNMGTIEPYVESKISEVLSGLPGVPQKGEVRNVLLTLSSEGVMEASLLPDVVLTHEKHELPSAEAGNLAKSGVVNEAEQSNKESNETPLAKHQAVKVEISQVKHDEPRIESTKEVPTVEAPQTSLEVELSREETRQEVPKLDVVQNVELEVEISREETLQEVPKLDVVQQNDIQLEDLWYYVSAVALCVLLLWFGIPALFTAVLGQLSLVAALIAIAWFHFPQIMQFLLVLLKYISWVYQQIGPRNFFLLLILLGFAWKQSLCSCRRRTSRKEFRSVSLVSTVARPRSKSI